MLKAAKIVAERRKMNPAPSQHLRGVKITAKQLREKASFAEELGYRDHSNTLLDAAETIEFLEANKTNSTKEDQ